MDEGQLIVRAQKRIGRVDPERPTDDDDLICDLLVALQERVKRDEKGSG